MALWIEFGSVFERAYPARDTETVEKVIGYARWCLNATSADTSTAVLCAFIEHLAMDETMRTEIPHWFTWEEFLTFRRFLDHFFGVGLGNSIAAGYRQLGKAR